MRSVSIATNRVIHQVGRASSWSQRLILAVSGGILIFAPLAYAAVHPWAYFTVGLVTAVLSLALLAAGLYQIWARPAAERFWPYPPLWWLAAGLVLVLFLQILPWPQAVIRWVSPMAWKIRALGNGFALADYIPLSLNPSATLQEGLKLWPAMVLFFILIFTVNTRQQIRRLVGLVLGVAFFEVLYGFWNFRSRLIWGWKNPYSGLRLCGTFINSNHLAGFLTMAILLGFGLFLAQRQAVPGLSEKGAGWDWLRRWSRAEHLEPRIRGYLLLFLLLLLTVGLIFTGSRGGMISLVMGFALMGLLIRGQRWPKGHIVLMIVFLVISVLYSLFLGSGPALARFLDVQDEGRYYAFKGALALFREFPWLGSGLATFGDLFYRYEPAKLKGVRFIYTHSDWFQLLAEAGLAGFFLTATAGGLFFSNLVQRWQKRQDNFARGVGLGGLAALGAGVFHGLVEFSFHIPAFILLFAAIAALTYLALHSHQQGLEYFSSPAISFQGRRWAASGILLSLMIFQLAFVLEVGYYWAAERAAPMEINSTRPIPKLEEENFRRALALNPRNSRYYSGRAEALRNSKAEDAASLTEMEKSLQAAVFYAPAHWGYRLHLSEFYLQHYPSDPSRHLPQALKELAAAVTLFPQSGLLQFRLGTLLAWMGKYYSGLMPPELRGRSRFYLEQAIMLEPCLQQYLPAPKNQREKP